MAYAPHYLLQFGGPLGTSGEEWSNSLRISPFTDVGAEPGINDVATDVTNFVQGAMGFWVGVRLAYVKLNAINALGHYAKPTTPAIYFAGADQPHGTNNVGHPPQCTMVMSLLTGTRGPSGRRTGAAGRCVRGR